LISQLLKEFYDEFQDKPFKWGEWDCIIFSAKWIEFSTGKVIYIPKYSSSLGSRKYNIINRINKELTETKNPKIGDIVVYKQKDNILTTGIKMENAILALHKDGLIPVCFNYDLAWELPCRH
jgi:hypothetical protein